AAHTSPEQSKPRLHGPVPPQLYQQPIRRNAQAMASWRRLALAGSATSPITMNTASSGTTDLASNLSLAGFLDDSLEGFWDDEAGTLSWCRLVGRVNFRLRWGRTKRSLLQAIGRLASRRQARSGPGVAETGVS